MLRLAETEAEQIRGAAHRTAAEVTERALSQAERHRHDVRQQLTAEAARAEEQGVRRALEMQERENTASERLTRARAEADAVRAAAERAADAHRAGAETAVEELRSRTADELGRARAQAERELARLRDLQGVARAELARIAAVIRTELAQSVRAPATRPSPRPTGRAAAGPADVPRPTPPEGAPDTSPHRYVAASR
jgi:hypothetical protein